MEGGHTASKEGCAVSPDGLGRSVCPESYMKIA